MNCTGEARQRIRRKAAAVMVARVCERYPVPQDLITRISSGSTSIFIPHIMQALVECGLDSLLFGDLYEKLFTFDSPEKVLVDAKFTNVYKVLEEIDNAGGVSVLASPVLDGCAGKIAAYAESGLCGVEVWHPSATENDVDMLLDVAKKHKLVAAGGTDFRGMFSPERICLGDVTTPEAQLSELLGYKTKKKRMQKKQSG